MSIFSERISVFTGKRRNQSYIQNSKKSSIAGEFLVAQLNRAFEAGLDLDAFHDRKWKLRSQQLVLTTRKAYNLAHFHEDRTAKSYLTKFMDHATIRLERQQSHTVDKLLDSLLLDIFR